IAPSFQRFGFSERPARTCWTMPRQVSSGQVHGFVSAALMVVICDPSAIVLESVDREGLTGDEAWFRRRKEYGNLGDVVGLAETPQRDVPGRDLRPSAAGHGIAE